MYIDYRQHKKVTIKNKYPLRRIDELFETDYICQQMFLVEFA